MTDIEKQPTPEKMEGGASEDAPPPYPTDPAFMQQPPPYPYSPAVYPPNPVASPGGDFPPPVQEINIQDSPAGGAGTT